MNEEVVNLIVLVGLLFCCVAFFKMSLRLQRENRILEDRLLNMRESLNDANQRGREYRKMLTNRQNELHETQLKLTTLQAMGKAPTTGSGELRSVSSSRRVQLIPDSAYDDTEMQKRVQSSLETVNAIHLQAMGLGYPPAFVPDEPQRAVRVDVACAVPPPGWDCSRTPHHSGPCAASPSESSYSSPSSSSDSSSSYSSDSSSSSSCDSGSSGSCGGGD